MANEIRVHVADYGRKNLYMRYVDPQTGKQVSRSTKTSDRKQADRVAAVWEDELQNGRYKEPSKITWDEFWELYGDAVYSSMADRTVEKIGTVQNSLEKYRKPARIAYVDANYIGG